MSEHIVIERHFRGPSESGNGGYTCGLVASFVDGPAEVTLRLPPPLDTPLRVECDDGAVRVFAADRLVAEAGPAEVDVGPLDPPAFDVASRAALPDGDLDSPFPQCFVCGPHREPGDGLRIFAGPLDDGVVAAPWVPNDRYTGPEFVWSALDCPGAYACGFGERGVLVLGRLAARVDALPRAGERCVVVGWPLGEEGRKAYAGTALYGEGGRLLGVARATWIEPLGLG
ncbi:MAG: hypothetical protein ACJ75P_12365 [Gaiellaceae bacterium]